MPASRSVPNRTNSCGAGDRGPSRPSRPPGLERAQGGRVRGEDADYPRTELRRGGQADRERIVTGTNPSPPRRGWSGPSASPTSKRRERSTPGTRRRSAPALNGKPSPNRSQDSAFPTNRTSRIDVKLPFRFAALKAVNCARKRTYYTTNAQTLPDAGGGERKTPANTGSDSRRRPEARQGSVGLAMRSLRRITSRPGPSV